MTPTTISVAIFLVAINAALLVWFRQSQAAASARRTMGMMMRIGLSPGNARLGDPRTEAIMKATRRRCRRCPREDLCDRWLAGKVGEDNTFCPNARTIASFAEEGARTA